MYQIALNKYAEFKEKLESSRKNIQATPPKPMSNIFGNFFTGIMKKINNTESNEVNRVPEQPPSTTQNTTFTNISYTASSNQMTEFNSDSISPKQTQQPTMPISNFVKPPTRPRKALPKKPIRRQMLAVPKKMPKPNEPKVLPTQNLVQEMPSIENKPIPKPKPMVTSGPLVGVIPPKRPNLKKKKRFKGNRFVAFDINKL
jgi:hypothetical protein